MSGDVIVVAVSAAILAVFVFTATTLFRCREIASPSSEKIVTSPGF
jgi:hypothetical protein